MKPYDYAANKAKLCDVNGRRLTTGLFEELQRYGVDAPPVFKLSDWKRIYIEVCDPTGYKAAMVLIGDWDHWLQLVSNPVFKAHLDEWNEEVRTVLKSEAIEALREQAKGPKGTPAAKYLAEHGYMEKKKKKEAVAPEDRAGEDAKRLGLRAIK